MEHEVYSEVILDHLMNPRNVGKIDNPSGQGVAGDSECGDYVEITLKIEDDFIKDVKFMVHGCVGAISTSSVATEIVKNTHVMKAFTLSNQEILDELKGLPDEKAHCSLLAPVAIKKAILDYIKNNREK